MMQSTQDIEELVKNKLTFEPELDDSKIQVSVDNGIVTLFGTVSTYLDKLTAERASRSVAGVKAVVNELKVDIAAKYKRSDKEIADAVINALKWDVYVPDNAIQVIVEEGHVSLKGKVNWWYQKQAAEKAVRNLHGIRSVVNEIEIKPIIKPQEVKKKIMAEFHRNATLDANLINVTVEENKVILSGTIHSWPEMKEATHAAWSVPGVTQVDNRLIIAP